MCYPAGMFLDTNPDCLVYLSVICMTKEYISFRPHLLSWQVEKKNCRGTSNSNFQAKCVWRERNCNVDRGVEFQQVIKIIEHHSYIYVGVSCHFHCQFPFYVCCSLALHTALVHLPVQLFQKIDILFLLKTYGKNVVPTK